MSIKMKLIKFINSMESLKEKLMMKMKQMKEKQGATQVSSTSH